MKIGKPRFGKGKKTFKIKDGDNIFGILPPMGNLADKGRWSMYYRVEWGYKDSNGKNRPFQDVRRVNRQSKMVEVESAAHLNREWLKQNKEEVVNKFRAGQATQEQVKKATELVRRFNLECRHYLNVITPTGEIGLLKIGHRGKIALDSAIKALQDQGVEAIGMKGVFFNINRYIPQGNPLDTTYTVTPYTENVEADIGGQKQIVQQRKHYELTESIINRLDSEAFELDSLYPEVTAEDVERFVEEGVPAIEEVLGKTQSFDSNDGVANKSVQQTTVQPEPVQQPVQQPVTEASPPAENKVGVQPSSKEVDKKEVKVEQKTDMNTESMDNDEFLKSIGAL